MIKPLPYVSLIIPAKNEGANVETTVRSAVRAKTRYSFEIIVVNDGSTDHCCAFLESPGVDKQSELININFPGVGAAKARNIGANHAKGKFFVFCDAHLKFKDGWLDVLIDALQTDGIDAISPGIADMTEPEKAGYGQTLKETMEVSWLPKPEEIAPVPILPGGCIAINRDIFNKIGGFDDGFLIWGSEDVELSLKLWLFGYRCYVHPHSKVYHLFRQKHPYKVHYNHTEYNMLRMAYSHFNEARIAKCKALIKYSNPGMIESKLLKSAILEQRSRYFKERKYDDDWFFHKFHIPF